MAISAGTAAALGGLGQASHGNIAFEGKGLNAPAEPSALEEFTRRLREQVAAAQTLESEIEAVARRLGGSSPTGSAEGQCVSGNQIQPPRIDELNNLVDELTRSLSGMAADARRLRRMVD